MADEDDSQSDDVERVEATWDPRPLSSLLDQPRLTMPNSFALEMNGPREELAKLVRCLYCPATELRPGLGEPLSEEHFVTEGLGSRLVLLEASCEKCAQQTNRFETIVLKHSLLAVRRKLRIRGKKRRRNEARFSVRVVDENGQEAVEWHTLDEHPTVMMLPHFDAPGILCGRPIGEGMPMTMFTRTFGDMDITTARSILSPRVDTVALCQLLAKIAHGFAVWRLGLGGFSPTLLDLIQDDGEDPGLTRYHWIGGDMRTFAPVNTLHNLGWGVQRVDGTYYLVVGVRLFSFLAGPVYDAVVGTLNQEQLAKARAVAEVLVPATDRDPGQAR